MSDLSDLSDLSDRSDQAALSVWNVFERLQENFERISGILRRIEAEDGDSRIRIAAAAENRKHIELAERLLETALRVEAQRKFEEFVLNALSRASVIQRRAAIDWINGNAVESKGAAGDSQEADSARQEMDSGPSG